MDFKKIKNIIFDLGDVIINIDPPRTYQAFADLKGITLEETYKIVDDNAFFDKYDKGHFSDQGFIDYVREKLEVSNSDQEIVAAWNALLLDMPKERIERIQELSKKYTIYLLSNTCSLHIIEVNNILYKSAGVKDLKDLFTTAYFSFDLGLRKPDKTIYIKVLDDANIKADETLFLDDNLQNIEAAQSLGIHCIHVQKPTTMLEYLKDA